MVNIFNFATFIFSFIVSLFTTNNSYSESKSIEDYGIITIMYHRFEENKYPSTNIRIEDFKSHIDLIKNSNFQFISHIFSFLNISLFFVFQRGEHIVAYVLH